MKRIQLHAYAKINLTLDVTGKRPNGYHDVEMIMQQISLCDEVTVSWEAGSVKRGKPGQTAEPDPTGIQIQLTVSRPDLPADSSNLAWKAAEEMIAEFGGPAGGNAKAAAGTEAAGESSKATAGTDAAGGVLTIDIQKQIPMAAGPSRYQPALGTEPFCERTLQDRRTARLRRTVLHHGTGSRRESFAGKLCRRPGCMSLCTGDRNRNRSETPDRTGLVYRAV